MPMRATDIRRKEFKGSFRGYDANAVDDFLDTVAEEFERLYADNQRMREEVSGLRDRLQQFEELEGSIRAALVHAEQAASDLRRGADREAEDVRQSARREADLTIKDAQNRSERMLADSAARIERVQGSYEALQQAKREFSNDFRRLLKTYLGTMEDTEVSAAKELEAALRDGPDAGPAASDGADPDEENGASEPSFVASEGDDPDDPDATQPIETVAADVEGPEEAGPPVEEGPDGDDQETRVLRPGESVTFGSDDPEDRPAAAAGAEEADTGETELEEKPFSVSGSAGGTTSGVGAEEEVEREEPTLAQESRSHEFFDQQEEDDGGRISRASRFLRRRD